MSLTYRYIGHATHVFGINGATVLVDPFFTSNPVTDVSADDVDANYILLTHGHFDHIEDTVAIAHRTGAKVIANFEIVNWLKAQGVPEEQTHPQHIGGGFHHEFGYLKLTIAFHGSSLPDGSYGGMPAGILIDTKDDRRIYIAGDTSLFSDMQLYRGAELFIVPIGDNFTMGPDDALQAVKHVAPKDVVPCHYNTWSPIEQNGKAWAERVAREVPDTNVHPLSPGGILELI